MIDIYTKPGKPVRLASVADIAAYHGNFWGIRLIDYSQEELNLVRDEYQLDLSIMNQTEDIEISSHFHETPVQLSFHFSVPYFNTAGNMVEESLFVVFTADKVFVFIGSGLDSYFNTINETKINQRKIVIDNVNNILHRFVGLLSDHYADTTEMLSKKIKSLALRVQVKKDFSDGDFDLIMLLNFNNMLVKESLNEFARILTLFRKSTSPAAIALRQSVDSELNDLTAVSDYIQFNFDRLDDLKDNISNKIDLEQNRIFKILTMVTVCIALPTLVAAVYAMNFETTVGLKWLRSYPIALLIMLLSSLIPIIYFRIKKWL